MKESRYEISKHRLVCENIRFSVFLDTVEMGGKIVVDDYMSIKPKTRNDGQITGVATLPIIDGKYGLLNIYRPPIQDFSWELPGGFIEPNETPALSAKRELEEEAGLICEEKDLVHLGSFHPLPGLVSGKLCIFSAEKCEPALQTEKPEFGISRFEWFSEEEIEDLIGKGLVDMAAALAFQRRTKLFSKSS